MSHSHSHSHESSPLMKRQERRALTWMVPMLVPIAMFTLVALVWLWPQDVASHIRNDSATVMAPGVTMVKGTITQVNEVTCDGMKGSSANDPRPCAKIAVVIDDGPDKAQNEQVPLTAAVYSSGVQVGQHVKLYRTPSPQDGSINYQFADFSRDAPLLFFAGMFAIAVVAVARWRGLASLAGLGFAFLVLGKFLFPALIVGKNPVLVGVVASFAIMFVVLYTAHGLSTRTTVALLGTFFGIMLSAGLGVWATKWAHLTGVTSEDDFLLASAAPDLHLQAAVMCGVVIAGLGVLNDVTITQTSAVWELAESGRSRRDLFNGAMRIGRDHIASTVYTTAFASVGAVLSVFLLLTIYQRPLAEVLTGEMFGGELVRTLVGAIGLVLAVPVTTAIAVAAVSAGGGPQRDMDRMAPEPPLTPVLPNPVPSAPKTVHAGSRAKRAAATRDDVYRRPSGPDEM